MSNNEPIAIYGINIMFAKNKGRKFYQDVYVPQPMGGSSPELVRETGVFQMRESGGMTSDSSFARVELDHLPTKEESKRITEYVYKYMGWGD